MTVFECPHCGEILEIEPPEKLHSDFSLTQPIPKKFRDKTRALQKRVKCSNPNCRKTIVVYWYAQLEYFSRI